jgi:dihydroorotate dehydrogenase (fumarate)
MDLSTTYLGFKLRTPLVVSASPMQENLDNVKHMAEAGASAVVLHSLYEEQLVIEQHELHHHTTHGTESFAEALTYFPEPDDFNTGPDRYLEHIRKVKEAVDIPVIASLNGSSLGGWTDFAKQMQEAGADALELNIYSIPTDIDKTGQEVEQIGKSVV